MNITPDQLKPGDVLLSLGTGLLSSLIRDIDGGIYSHAAFFDGDKLVEAAGNGVIRSNSVEDECKLQTFVDAYRFRKRGSFLGDPGFPVGPVIDASRRFVSEGSRFAYHQLCMMLLLSTSRRLDLPPAPKHILRELSDKAFAALENIIAAGKQPVTCSELVFRIFSEARPADYELHVDNPFDKELLLATVTREAHASEDTPSLQSIHRDFVDRYITSKHALDHKGLTAVTATEVVPDFVSPKDLQNSPTLSLLGRVTP